MYGDYIRERTSDHYKETDKGWVTYRYLNEKQCYIIDIYTRPDFRQTGAASTLADLVVEEAKSKGCSELIGTVVPSMKNSTISLKVLFAYGMDLQSCHDNVIICKKDL
jgi:ribosomal protein S18 acetylase RimI-like enzyme